MSDASERTFVIWTGKGYGLAFSTPGEQHQEYVRADLYDALAKERDELRAEVERLTNLVSDSEKERYRSCGELLQRAEKAEAERDELTEARDLWQREFENQAQLYWIAIEANRKAEAEVERLRNALSEFAEWPNADMPDSEFKRGWNSLLDPIRVRASVALQRKEGNE